MYPKRAIKIEKFLKGKELTSEVVAEAAELIPEEIAPITDIRATKEYRTHMCKVMFKRGIIAAKERMEGNGPDFGHHGLI